MAAQEQNTPPTTPDAGPPAARPAGAAKPSPPPPPAPPPPPPAPPLPPPAARAGPALVRKKPASEGRLCPQDMAALRDAFWSNVVRDMLNALVMLRQQQPELFDGRFAVLTKGGERIPIAELTPVFAVTVADSDIDLETSMAVQCTVFRVQTPSGEVFTVPLQEIRALHTMTPALLDRLQRAAVRDRPRRRSARRGPGAERADEDDDDDRQPFGFAAFTALPKPAIVQPAPTDPTE